MSLVEKVTWKSGVDTSDIIESKVQELVDSGTIGVEGWSIVKTGIIQLADTLSDNAAKGYDVDLTDFGFKSTDDYFVALSVMSLSTASEIKFVKVLWNKSVSTAMKARIAFQAVGGEVTTNAGVSYAIIAKSSAVVKTMEEDSGWIKPNGNNNLMYRKIGNLVEVKLYNYEISSLNTGQGVALTTLPEGYIPNITVYSGGLDAGWSTGVFLSVEGGTSGRLFIRNQSGHAITSVYGSVMYFVD